MLSFAAPLAAHAVTGQTVLANPIDPSTLLNKFGLIGLAIILFAETGLLVGFFLPGDTLLLSAGISISIGTLNDPLWKFLVVAPIAAFIGNLVGYWIGYRAGPKVFDKPDSKFFSPEYVTKAERFFNRFGSWTIVLARFVPVVRTVASVMAGVGKMRFSLYVLYSVIGGILWTDSMLIIGHQLGKFQFVQDNKQYLDYIIMAVVILSLLPTLIHYLRNRNKSRVQVGSDAP
ncbi:membrane-associated protein [Jatrophihabitans sp. GAS493]|uniref:DedA family protein n=1 Tax=Jatrophihabitans sp. GAS493 TaxID=1907575 RepID=UPI000BB877E0|nr:VTT domain-containing protein [Jatrophihabitans sp. GAS493]SOD71600.1 membrane-associated protein [Jatrophihabitans sp. GAS493]